MPNPYQHNACKPKKCPAWIAICFLWIAGPVSYTHLDVYKRQVLHTFTKFVKLYSVKRATSKVLSEKITGDYMTKIGKPKVILSDRGPQFIGGTWRQTLGWEGIIPNHTAVYHPQSNQADRVMREIGRILRAYCHAKHSEWPSYVNKIEEWLNCTTHESTGFTPYELVKGTRPPRILEQLFNYPPESNARGMDIKVRLANENLLRVREGNRGMTQKVNGLSTR